MQFHSLSVFMSEMPDRKESEMSLTFCCFLKGDVLTAKEGLSITHKLMKI